MVSGLAGFCPRPGMTIVSLSMRQPAKPSLTLDLVCIDEPIKGEGFTKAHLLVT
jgi:hypothetical protein